MALQATWQRHAGPRGAYAAYTYTYYLCSLYNGYSAFRISEGFSNPLFVGCYKPIDLLYFILCGTNPHDVLLNAGHVAEGEMSDRVEFDRGASITWTRGPLDHHQAHVL